MHFGTPYCTWKSRKPEVGKPQTPKLPAPPHLPPLPPPPHHFHHLLPLSGCVALSCETGVATRVSTTWRNHSSSGYLLVIIMETKGGCHCHAHALVHHHLRLPPPRAPTPTTHTAAPPTAQMRIFLRFLVRKWTRTGSSYVLGHADSAMIFVFTIVILVGKQ